MTPVRAASALLAAGAISGLLACSSAAPVPVASSARVQGCPGLTEPRLLAAPVVILPNSLTSVHIGVAMPGVVVLGSDGALRESRIAETQFAFLAPYAAEALKHAQFSGASIDGNPAAARLQVFVPVGQPSRSRPESIPPSLWAFVPGEESRESRWQLRDSVRALTLVAHVGNLARPGATVAAVAPGGAEKILLAIPPADAAQDIRETVKTGRFLYATGTYRLELRVAGAAAAVAEFTVADDYKQAIVNACEPVTVSRKVGPGN